MTGDLRTRIAEALDAMPIMQLANAARPGYTDDILDAIMAVLSPARTGHEPYCEGGHGAVVTCVQVATLRRDSARDPWRCWHNPYPTGRPCHSFGDGDVCVYEGCGARLSELRSSTPGAEPSPYPPESQWLVTWEPWPYDGLDDAFVHATLADAQAYVARRRTELAPNCPPMRIVEAVTTYRIVEDEAARGLTVTDWEGRCRKCSRRVEPASWDPGREIWPHRMICEYYVGPVEHRRFPDDEDYGPSPLCVCGARWAGDPPVCENAAETWRGPKDEEQP